MIKLGEDKRKQENNTGFIQIYPNPATDRVNINASSEISNIVNFNTGQFDSGMYMFKIQTAKGMFVESVIIK